MARTLALVAGLALLLACKLEPGGRCMFDAQCRAGLECTGGLCVVRDAGADLGASCAVDSDCVAWGSCRANVCVLEPGACVANGDCPAWQACTTDHVCTLATGKCASNADCVSWKTCSLTNYTCALITGRCDAEANCASWQNCDLAAHACVTDAPTYCGSASDCAAWESCPSGTHKCTLVAGKCGSDANCDTTWARCDVPTSNCVALPGFCATTADCGPFRTCQSNRCVSSDGTDVLLCGELTAGDATTYALSLVGDPATPITGFRAGFGAPRLDAYGAILYVDPRWNGTATVDTLVRLVPDALTWDATSTIWYYPADPTANDVVVPTPTCAAGAIQRWIVRAGTGEVFHSCDPDAWYDTAGNLRFTEPAGKNLVAWNASDAKLVVTGLTYSVVDAAGTEHPLTGLPSVSTFYGARTHGAGFWIALQNATTTDDELWAIDGGGVATLAGAYPFLAGGISVLDDSGRAYTWTAGQIVRRTAGGTTTEPLYDAGAGASVWTTNPATWWVSAAGPIFVTGP
jgi:hypothetical protein